MNTLSFYLEDDNHEELNFNGETLTFTLQMIKVWAIECAFKNDNVLVIAWDKNTTPVQKTLLMR